MPDASPVVPPPDPVTRLVERIWPLGPRREGEELLDGAGHDPAELAANLRDIRRVNRLGGGTATVLRHLPALLATVPRERPARVLDLATGSGDIPLAAVRWARSVGRPLEVTASDLSAEILAAARQTLGHLPEVRFARYDARAVPLPDGAVDVVLCSLALHHLPPAEATAVLREMLRLGAVGFILNDVERSRAGWVAAWAASRVGTRNRLTRHDMPFSVRRAYTAEEIAALLAAAGAAGARIHRHPLFRLAAVKAGETATGTA